MRDDPAAQGRVRDHPPPDELELHDLGAVHVSLSGSARNLIVAGGIFLLALLGSIGQDRKKVRLIGQRWRDWQARTSFVPFAALLNGKVRMERGVSRLDRARSAAWSCGRWSPPTTRRWSHRSATSSHSESVDLFARRRGDAEMSAGNTPPRLRVSA